MNRFEFANLACVGLIMLAVIAGVVAVGWAWWAVLIAAVGAFFGGGWVIERLTPGTRLLQWLGWDGEDERSPDGNQ